MARFVDEYSPECMPSYPCLSSPRWHNDLVTIDSGDEAANQRWTHPLFKFTLPSVAHTMATYNAVRDHWMAMRGTLHTWPFRDPLDCSSGTMSVPYTDASTQPTISPLDQSIGTGDGSTTTFQLVRQYAVGSQTYDRKVELPVQYTVRVALNGVEQAGSPSLWTVSRPGGVITFFTAPGNGVAITAGFLFDVEVRFESDDAFDGILKNWRVAGCSDIPLIQVRHCTDDD